MTLQEAGAEDLRAGRTFNRSMGLLAAVAIAAGVGLAAIDVPESELRPGALQTDANEQRTVGTQVPGVAVPFAAPSRVLDSTLSRPEPGSDQHG